MYRYVHRDRAVRDARRMTVTIPLDILEGEEAEHEHPPPPQATLDEDGEYMLALPARYEICDRCEGRGTHTNPNIDGHGISQDEWEQDWGDEDREMYRSGGYDVRCEEGCTDGKVLVVAEDAVEQSLKVWVERWREREKESAREARYDARTRWAEDGYPSDY